MKIEEITNYNPEIQQTISKFLNQLIETESNFTREQFEAIISDPNSHLFFASSNDNDLLGMLTVGFYHSPTGKKAWIEDVVVDQVYRGLGAGKALINFSIQFAKEQQADVVMLTSKPERISANNLYKKTGFRLKETNVYKMQIK